MGCFKLEDIHLGETRDVRWTITRESVDYFIKATGDDNRAHTKGIHFFGNLPVAHGMLTASLWSRIFGTIFPGEASVYSEQSIKWLKPVFIGDTVIGNVEVSGVDLKKRLVSFKTKISKQSGEDVAEGTALIYIPKIR